LQIQELAELGIKIEKHYKYPQDVEWAFSKGKLYPLQSRKIAGMGKPSKQDYAKHAPPVPNNPENIWSRQGGDEFMADYVMPLSHFFLVKWIVQYANKEMAELFGRRDLADVPVLRRHNGYIYVSGLYFRKFLQFIPRNARTMDMINWFPEAFRDKIIAEPFRIDFLLKTLGIFFKDHRVLLKKNQQALKRHILNIKKYIIPKLQQDYSGLTEAQWHREQDEVEEYAREHFRTIRYGLLYNQTFVSILSGLLKKWCGDKDGIIYQHMISGFPETKTAEVNRNIYKLSMTAREDDNFTTVLLDQRRSYTEIREITKTHTFWQKFDAFITEHGHRCASRELAFPRWWEKPEIVIGFIRSQLQAVPPPPDPEKLEAETIRKREETERAAILKAGQGKGGWLRRKVLTWVINKNRDFMIYRENQRYFLDAVIARSRALIVEQGRRLTDAGVLKDPSEVFYLEKGEFDALLKKPHPSPQIRLKIEERRKHHEEWGNKLPALYLYDDVEVDDDPADSCRTIQPDAGEGNYVASGLPAVQGKVRAPARVVTSLEQLDQIKQGEILITINTDPGWTCVFPMLAGLVTETGGLLSHGAILARDYGIPAVMGVRGVTSAIRTGEMVTIDGLKGEIRKL
jgi:pyruvate,water dikinase